MKRIAVCLALLTGVAANAETDVVPTGGVSVGVGWNSASHFEEAPISLFAGVQALTALGSNAPSTPGEPLPRGITAIGMRLEARAVFSGRRYAVLEPELLAILATGFGLRFGAGGGVSLAFAPTSVPGALIAAEVGNSFVSVQARARTGLAQPRVELAVRLDLVSLVGLTLKVLGVISHD